MNSLLIILGILIWIFIYVHIWRKLRFQRIVKNWKCQNAYIIDREIRIIPTSALQAMGNLYEWAQYRYTCQTDDGKKYKTDWITERIYKWSVLKIFTSESGFCVIDFESSIKKWVTLVMSELYDTDVAKTKGNFSSFDDKRIKYFWIIGLALLLFVVVIAIVVVCISLNSSK